MPTSKFINPDIAGGGNGSGGPSVNVVDNLTSTSSNDALSANQGRLLNQLAGSKLSQEELKDILNDKQDLITNVNSSQVKETLNIDNLDNTADMDKPVSTLQQNQLDNKSNIILSPVAGNVVIQNSYGHIQDSGETIADLKDGWDGEVNTFADLPLASSNNGKKYVVKTPTGTIVLGTKKYAGTYISNGASWSIFGYKQASVLNQTLSGFTQNATVESLVSNDSILTSLQKIQKWFSEYFSNLTGDIQSQINNKEEKILAKSYVDAQVTDIKTVIDNWGSQTALTGYNYQLHANYSGPDITIDDYYNISFTGTNNPAGSPHTVFYDRSLTLTGSNCTRIKIININIENGLIVNGTLGRHYFEKCSLGGLTVSSTSNWMVFTDCTFDGPVTINSNFAGVIYFVRCAFNGQSLTLNNYVSTQIALIECSGLSSIPSNAFKSGMTALTSGVQSFYLNGSALSTTPSLTLNQDSFYVGDVNGNSSQKTADEVKTILNLNIIDENNHIKEINLNPNVTLAGRTFNTAGKLVQLDTDGNNGPRLPILDGSQLVDIDITKVKNSDDESLPTILNSKADAGSLGLIDDNGVQKYEKIEMRYGEYNDGYTEGGLARFESYTSKPNVWGVRRVDDTFLCIQASNGQFYAYGFNTISDKRIKKDIKDISIETIDKLSKIKPKTFVYDGISEDTHIGYIAQELEETGLDFVVTDTLEEQDFKTENEAKEYFDKAKKQGFEPKIKQSGNGYLVTYNKKGVKYNEIAVLQQALINDLHSVLRTQGLSFLIDDIKEVYNNEYDNTYEVLTIQGDLIKSIEKNGNTQEQRIDVWVANGGKVINKVLTKDKAIDLIKKENNRRVRTIGNKELSKNEWLQKTQNSQDVINRFTSQLVGKSLNGRIVGKEVTQAQYNNAVKLIERKDQYVFHYHEKLKPMIHSMKDLELKSFDPFSDALWEGLN